MQQPIDTQSLIRNLSTMLRVTPRGNARDEEMRDKIELELTELRAGRRREVVLRDFTGDEVWFQEARRRARIV